MAVDPVCGMTVDPATAAGQYDYQGVTYYFCATSCLETFKRNPQLALQAREPEFITLGRNKPLPMMPASTSAESVALSKELKKRGWKFVGPTTVYAFMQAMGLVNDHVEGCHARAQALQARAALTLPRS